MKKKSNFLGFEFAFKGILAFFAKERNAKIHLLATVIVLTAGFYFHVDPAEWLWISLAIVLVFISEMINSAIELLCDLVMPEQNDKAGKLKDIAAGAVLIASIFSLIVAGIVFIPRIILLF